MGIRLSSLLVAIALVAAACSSGSGGDSLSAADQELADAIAQSMVDSAGIDAPIAAEDAACFGTGIVTEMGSDRLNELGLDVASVEAGTSPTDVELTDGDIDAMASVFAECIDFGSVIAAQFEGLDVSEDSIKCLTDGFDEDLSAQVARSVFAGGDVADGGDASQAIFDLILNCFTTEELANLGS